MGGRLNDGRDLDDDREDEAISGRHDVMLASSYSAWQAAVGTTTVPPPLDDGRDMGIDGRAPSDIYRGGDGADGRSGGGPTYVGWSIEGPAAVGAGTPATFRILRSGKPIAAGHTESIELASNVSGGAVLVTSLVDQITEQLSGPDAPIGIRMLGTRLYFDAGAPNVFSFSVTVAADPIQSGDRMLELSISDVDKGAIVTGAARVEILDIKPIVTDEPSEIAVVTPLPISEGSAADVTNMRFFVDRSGAGNFADHEVTFQFQTLLRAGPSSIPEATPGVDYAATSGMMTFAAGVTRVAIDVKILGDTTPETDEFFDFRITNAGGPAGTAIVGAFAQGVITNDDAQPFEASLFSVLDAATVLEGDPDAPGDKLVFTVVREGGSNFAQTNASVAFNTFVDFLGGGPQANPANDYVATSGVLSFAAGQTARLVTVDILGDSAAEKDEFVNLRLSDASGQPGTRIVDGQAVGLVLDDDTVGPSHISARDATPVLEGDPGDNASLVFEIVRTGVGDFLNATATVDFETWFNFFPDGKAASPGLDYASTSGTVVFAAGQTLQFVTVAILEDDLLEQNEIVSFRLSNPTGPQGTDVVGVTAEGLIVDDDIASVAPSRFVIRDPATASEGDPGAAGVVIFMVERLGTDNYANAPAAISFRTIATNPSPGLPAATPGEDYVATTGVLQFGPTETAKLVTVQLAADLTYEPDEFMTVELFGASGPPGTSINDRFGTVRIADDDIDQVSASRFRISDAEWTLENDPGQGFATLDFEITRVGSGNFADAEATLQVETLGRVIDLQFPPATDGSDFVDYDGPLVFEAGVTARTFQVRIVGDNFAESNEGVAVKLLSVDGAPGSSIVDGEGVGLIVDDDTAINLPSLFSIASLGSVSEGDPGDSAVFMMFEVTRDGAGSALAAEVSVDFQTFEPFPPVPNAATGGIDYVPVFRTVTFAPAETAKLVAVEIVNDEISEGSETIYARILNPQGPAGAFIVGSSETSAQILNDDTVAPPSSFSVQDAAPVVEGNVGDPDKVMVFDVVRTGSGSFANAVTAIEFGTHFDFFGENPQAAPNTDYLPTSGYLVFEAGVTVKQVTVALLPDAVVEKDEAVTLRVFSPSGPPGTNVTDGEAIGFIEDNDDKSIFRLVGDGRIAEGGKLVFTVTRSGAADELQETASVDIRTRPGSVAAQTATPDLDFAATSASLTFGAGQTSKQFTVTTLQDSVGLEGDEIVQVQILNPENGTIATGQNIQSGTIVDATGPAVLSVAFAGLGSAALGGFEGDPGGAGQLVRFRVTRTGDLSQETSATLSIDFAASTANAADLVDAGPVLVSFAPGQSSTEVQFQVVADTLVEADEHIAVALSGVANGTIDPTAGTAQGGWSDDDVAFRLIGGDSTTEGGKLVFTVIRSAHAGADDALDEASAIDIRTRGPGVVSQTATPNVDFAATFTTLNFAAGQTQKLFTVATLADTVAGEGNETVQILINNPTNGAIQGGAIKSGTIGDFVAPVLAIDFVGYGRPGLGAYEGDVGGLEQSVLFRVTRTGDLSKAGQVTVSIDFALSTATASDIVNPGAVTVDFAPGQATSSVVKYRIRRDNVAEPDEGIAVVLSQPVDGILDPVRTVAVAGWSDDDIEYRLSGGDMTTEGGDLVFKVVRVADPGADDALDQAGSIQIRTRAAGTNGQTATPDVDFDATSATLNFAAGQTQKLFTVSTLADSVAGEGNEKVHVVIENTVNGVITGGNIKSGTIQDFVPPTLSIDFQGYGRPELGAVEGSPGGLEQSVLFRVTRAGDLSKASQATVAIDFASSTANVSDIVNPGAVTVSFAPGQSTSSIVKFRIRRDATAEADEHITVALANPVNATLNPGKIAAIGAWVDDDAPAQFKSGTLEFAAILDGGDDLFASANGRSAAAGEHLDLAAPGMSRLLEEIAPPGATETM